MLKPDDLGKFPDYVVYHELIATPRPYMRNVCAVEMRWVVPILNKLKTLDVRKLRLVCFLGLQCFKKCVTGLHVIIVDSVFNPFA